MHSKVKIILSWSYGEVKVQQICQEKHKGKSGGLSEQQSLDRSRPLLADPSLPLRTLVPKDCDLTELLTPPDIQVLQSRVGLVLGTGDGIRAWRIPERAHVPRLHQQPQSRLFIKLEVSHIKIRVSQPVVSCSSGSTHKEGGDPCRFKSLSKSSVSTCTAPTSLVYIPAASALETIPCNT